MFRIVNEKDIECFTVNASKKSLLNECAATGVTPDDSSNLTVCDVAVGDEPTTDVASITCFPATAELSSYDCSPETLVY